MKTPHPTHCRDNRTSKLWGPTGSYAKSDSLSRKTTHKMHKACDFQGTYGAKRGRSVSHIPQLRGMSSPADASRAGLGQEPRMVPGA